MTEFDSQNCGKLDGNSGQNPSGQNFCQQQNNQMNSQVPSFLNQNYNQQQNSTIPMNQQYSQQPNQQNSFQRQLPITQTQNQNCAQNRS